jgi:hypothetical protein
VWLQSDVQDLEEDMVGYFSDSDFFDAAEGVCGLSFLLVPACLTCTSLPYRRLRRGRPRDELARVQRADGARDRHGQQGPTRLPHALPAQRSAPAAALGNRTAYRQLKAPVTFIVTHSMHGFYVS